MTTYKVNKSGVTFNGRVYKEGETFDLADNERGGSGPKQFLFDRVRNGEHPDISKVEEPRKASANENVNVNEEEEAKKAAAEIAEKEEAAKKAAKTFEKTGEGVQETPSEEENKSKAKTKE